MMKKNPSKAQRRKAIERAASTLSNYVLYADSGVARGYYSQADFGHMYKMIERLDKIAKKMR
tara:strand:+ start:222 stop:407 length:186 start_codon:yes stop_codon:yes gene_type:complete